MPGAATNRHLSDRVIRGLIEREGVIGLIPLNTFLKVGWLRKNGSRREEVSLWGQGMISLGERIHPEHPSVIHFSTRY